MAIVDFDPRTMAEIGAMQETMKTLEKLGSQARGADLNAKKRVDPESADRGYTNADILRFLKDDERDFLSMGDKDKKAMAQKYVEGVAGKIQKQAKRNANLVAKGKRTQVEIDAAADRQATEAARVGLYAAMDEAKEIISDRILEGRVADGSAVRDLSEQYKKDKLKKHKHVYPVGIASGQVLENLTEGKSNVKITRN